MRTSRAGAEHGVCASGASQQHRKTQRIRALTRGSPPTTVISPKSSASWASSHARHLTKDLGAYSPREIHMRKPMSAHELYNRALLVGMPPCLTQETRRPTRPRNSRPASRGKTPRQGTGRPLRDKRLAKLSPELVEFSPSRVSSPLEPPFLSYATWAACTSKGGSRASCLESPYLSKPYAPPGLVEP